jgi:Uma2 family endonuclease
VIIEVLSKSTAALDRGEKFESYRKLDSLMEYLLEGWTKHKQLSAVV